MTERAVTELACVAPAFLDLTYIGLEKLPEPGREHFARDLLRSPGGGALHAMAAARLGVRTVAAFPLGDDEAGELIRAALLDAGADVVGVGTARTAVTVAIPLCGDRAMVTYQPEDSPEWSAIAALDPVRVLCTIAQIEHVPHGARTFVCVNGRDLERCAAGLPSGPPIDTLFVNEREAMTLSAMPDIEDAARKLAERAHAVVVTLGDRGAFACTSGEVVMARGIAVDAVDTTGAGDLFAGAWIWGDVLGLGVRARLQWAVLYASLSVTVPTGAAGVITLEQLLAEGERRGMRLAGAIRTDHPIQEASLESGVE